MCDGTQTKWPLWTWWMLVMAGLNSNGSQTRWTQDVPMDGRMVISAQVRMHGTITLLIQADHLSLVAPSCNYCLLSIVSLRWGGMRRAVKKSMRLLAKRKGMGPRSGRQSQQQIRFHLIIIGESKSIWVGPLLSSFPCAHDWGNSLVTECIASQLLSQFATTSQWARPRLWLKWASVPVANAMSGQLPNTSQDNVLTNSCMASQPYCPSLLGWPDSHLQRGTNQLWGA